MIYVVRLYGLRSSGCAVVCCRPSWWVASPRSEAGEPASHDADAADGEVDSHRQQKTLLPAEALLSADPQRIGQNGHQRGQRPERDEGVTHALRAQLSHGDSSLAVANRLHKGGS